MTCQSWSVLCVQGGHPAGLKGGEANKRPSQGRLRHSVTLSNITKIATVNVILSILTLDVWICISAPRVTQMEGNSCEILWETVPPMKGDPVNYILQVLVGRESEYKQVRTSVHGTCLAYQNQAGSSPLPVAMNDSVTRELHFFLKSVVETA